jgi:uncharacterized membrane protein
MRVILGALSVFVKSFDFQGKRKENELMMWLQVLGIILLSIVLMKATDVVVRALHRQVVERMM